MEALIGLLLLGGCTVGITSPFVSPVIILLLLVSATFRAKSSPFLIIGIITACMLLISSGFAFASLDWANDPSSINYIKEENARTEKVFFPLAALCFAIMGILIGFVMRSKTPETSSWISVTAKALFSSLFISFVVGYLLLGIMSLIFVVPFASGSLHPPPFSGGIWMITLFFYPSGGFLIPGLTATLTRLCLDFCQRRFNSHHNRSSSV